MNKEQHFITVLVGAIFLISGTTGLLASTGSLQDREDKEQIPGSFDPVAQDLSATTGWFTENQGQLPDPGISHTYDSPSCSIAFMESDREKSLS